MNRVVELPPDIQTAPIVIHDGMHTHIYRGGTEEEIMRVLLEHAGERRISYHQIQRVIEGLHPEREYEEGVWRE